MPTVKKLDQSILKDLETGCAHVRFVDAVEVLGDTTFDDANEIFTVEGTLNIDQADASKTEFKIDQSDIPVGIAWGAGEFSIKGKVPSVAVAMFDEFYTQAVDQPTITGVKSGDGVSTYTKAHGYELEAKRRRVSIMIESASKKTALVFMNVELVATFKWGNVKTEPAGIELSGSVLLNTKANAPSFIILKA